MNKKIEIFDLDGTLTDEHHPLWNLITERLVEDPAQFNQIALQWQADFHSEKFPNIVTAATEMMEIGLAMLLPHNRNAEVLIKTATEITHYLINKGAVRKDAIDYIQQSISQGVTCVISTGSYSEGAAGFINALIEANWLNPETAKQIILSGNRIDWPQAKALHMNVGHGKVTGLEYSLKQSLAEFQQHIIAAFGDDPAVNDRAILALAPVSFCIPTSKNSHFPLPPNCQRLTWEEIRKRPPFIE